MTPDEVELAREHLTKIFNEDAHESMPPDIIPIREAISELLLHCLSLDGIELSKLMGLTLDLMTTIHTVGKNSMSKIKEN